MRKLYLIATIFGLGFFLFYWRPWMVPVMQPDEDQCDTQAAFALLDMSQFRYFWVRPDGQLTVLWGRRAEARDLLQDSHILHPAVSVERSEREKFYIEHLRGFSFVRDADVRDGSPRRVTVWLDPSRHDPDRLHQQLAAVAGLTSDEHHAALVFNPGGQQVWPPGPQ